MKPNLKLIFFSVTLCIASIASASPADDYCTTRMHKITEVLKSVVYCGYNQSPIFETKSAISALWSFEKIAALEQESLLHLSSQDYIEVMKFQEGGIPVKLFVKRSAALKEGEALCYTRLGILRCTPGAKVLTNLASGPSDLKSILKQNGYTEVAANMFRK